MLASVLRDLRYATRALLRDPGFTGVAVLALALGIGANSAIFTVINSVLLQPLHFSKPEQLVWVHERNVKLDLPVFSLSPGNYADFRDHNQSFTGFCAFQQTGMNLSGADTPERLTGARVTVEFFDVLGAEPFMGRKFAPGEMFPGSGHVVLLSYGLWQRHFGGDRSVVGKSLNLNAEPYTVIGVMPQGFQYPDPSDLWTPLALERSQWEQRGGHYLNGIARLKSGATVAGALADLNTIAARAERQFPDTNTGWDTMAKTLQDQFVGQYRQMLWSLAAIVGAVLLIACANLANLLLSRSASRRREIAIRSSLGARRGRLIRQLLTESILLAGIGAAAGLALAWAATRLLVSYAPDILPRAQEIGLDWRVVAFTAAVAVITGILFGVAPALDLAKNNLAAVVREGGRGNSIGFRRNRLRSALVIGEVALALTLLFTAGLLIRSFYRLQLSDPGFDARRVLSFRTDLPNVKYKNDDQVAAFYSRLLERIRSLRGVSSAGVAQNVPLSGDGYVLGVLQIGKPSLPRGTEPSVEYYAASSGYFPALRIPLKAGRYFDDHDDAAAPPVMIVDETFARRFYPGENPLGQRIQVTNGTKPGEIVGVVGDVREIGVDTANLPAVYQPAAQNPLRRMYFSVRAAADPAALIPGVRQVIREMDSDLPLDSVGTVDSRVAKSISMERFATVLTALFAGLALLLAMVGIYGALSYAVTQAAREIGIRIALGARGGVVLKMVLRHAAILVGVGFAIGLPAALGVGRLLAGALYKVKPEDPLTYVAVTLILLLTALAACVIPALRASRVDPLVALRLE